MYKKIKNALHIKEAINLVFKILDKKKKGEKMLEIKNISKTYETDNLKQVVLNKVNINFRKNEFVSILGPSGSGKTTLLNIIGGLDRYDSGDLIINEVSTKKYTESNWDSYRNHRVGFVFQNYNLISHQTILQNVELALTLSGISRIERKKRAKKALKNVGLEKHAYKLPSQLSGGQMQRVAIARALVNDPDILLADEPTGALDSVTSKQVMDLLKKVAKNKLVIMVTHNPELANLYSTRIIKLKDGKIIDDLNPYNGDINTKEDIEVKTKKSKKTSMSLLTALSLSLNNLLMKKGRTFLISFAGSIGIIGISLILSLSNGVQNYINKTQKETLANYPISIKELETDITSMMNESVPENKKVTCKNKNICTIDNISKSSELRMSTLIKKNNLNEFKKYLDNNGGKINEFITDIQYLYNLDLQIYSANNSEKIVKVNPNTFSLINENNINMDANKGEGNFSPNYSMTLPNAFKELVGSKDLLNSQYEILSGKFPSAYNEMILVVDENNQIPASVMYSLDIENRSELAGLVDKIKNGEDVSLDSINYDYNSLINKNFKLVLNSDYYKKENNKWIDKSNDYDYMKNLIKNGIDIKIVGIMKARNNVDSATSGYVLYTHDLIKHVIDEANKRDIVIEQLNNKDIDILTGNLFDNMTSTYESNCKKLGIVSLDNPSNINIYPKNFEAKEHIEDIINDYNDLQDNKDNIIIYTDMIGILFSSIKSIINVISYILIAFVAVSLIVSSIMIAIITYISVLERTKEIGILRAIGASKKDITRVFNAETIIEGFSAGLIGVLVGYLLTIPINIIIKNMLSINNIAKLEINSAIILIVISVMLNVVSGFIPARVASKKDPVESLRCE